MELDKGTLETAKGSVKWAVRPSGAEEGVCVGEAVSTKEVPKVLGDMVSPEGIEEGDISTVFLRTSWGGHFPEWGLGLASLQAFCVRVNRRALGPAW